MSEMYNSKCNGGHGSNLEALEGLKITNGILRQERGGGGAMRSSGVRRTGQSPNRGLSWPIERSARARAPTTYRAPPSTTRSGLQATTPPSLLLRGRHVLGPAPAAKAARRVLRAFPCSHGTGSAARQAGSQLCWLAGWSVIRWECNGQPASFAGWLPLFVGSAISARTAQNSQNCSKLLKTAQNRPELLHKRRAVWPVWSEWPDWPDLSDTGAERPLFITFLQKSDEKCCFELQNSTFEHFYC